MQAFRPGTLTIEHGPGLVVAWLEDAAVDPATDSVAVNEPARIVKLAGRAMRFTVAPAAPALLSMRTTAPVIATLIPPDGAASVEVFPDGGLLTRYIPPGRTAILVQSASDGALAGDAEFIQSPVTPIDEGLGAATRLGAGETRLYGFALDQGGTVGVGLRASVDVATCDLLDGTGKVLGTGIVQMHDLPAGRFILAVTLPAGAAPIEIQPALVGVRRPDTGPPDEVKRKYLQLVGRLPSE
jgi:hypothetical protein